MIASIVDYDWEYDQYELCCAAGVLNGYWARSQFDRFDTAKEYPVNLDRTVGLREAVRITTVGGGQGLLKCNSNGRCDNNKCKCKKNNLLCNSRCHHGNAVCINKN